MWTKIQNPPMSSSWNLRRVDDKGNKTWVSRNLKTFLQTTDGRWYKWTKEKK